MCPSDQPIMEEPSILAASAMEGSRTALDETVMPPPSTPRAVKRKALDKDSTLPVNIYFVFKKKKKKNIYAVKSAKLQMSSLPLHCV